MYISSVNNDRIKDVVRLKEKKYRDKNGLFYVEGLDIVDEAYKSGLLVSLFVLDGYQSLYDDVESIYVSMDVMKKISDLDSVSGYFGVCKKKQDMDIGNRIVILDNIQDPGNLGTIIRSACAFNFDTVVLSKNSVDLYNPKVIRSTKGMLFNVNIITRDLISFIRGLDNYLVYGTSVLNGVNIKDVSISDKMAIVIGNEGTGVSQEVMDLCSKNVYIKMNEACESLNAGVAGSILMYEVDNR